MNAVLGYTQLIESDAELPEKYRRPLKAIRAAGNHLIGLIDDILDISKIEAGAMELHPRDFDLGDLSEDVSEMFAMLNSCAPGLTVVNFDNGFGAGYAAAQINRG